MKSVSCGRRKIQPRLSVHNYHRTRLKSIVSVYYCVRTDFLGNYQTGFCYVRTNPARKPVLAWEREARFKEERRRSKFICSPLLCFALCRTWLAGVCPQWLLRLLECVARGCCRVAIVAISHRRFATDILLAVDLLGQTTALQRCFRLRLYAIEGSCRHAPWGAATHIIGFLKARAKAWVLPPSLRRMLSMSVGPC